MKPLVSVVTPSYNQKEFLAENIESVKNQSMDDVEHVVIDGGSEDGTVDVLRREEENYNLKWVSEADRGQSHAINKGIEMADGEWIIWLNSDDYLLPRSLAKASTNLSDDHDVVYGDFIFVDEHKNEVFKQYNTIPSKRVERYWTRFAGNHCTFFRKKLLNEIGGVDESLEYTMDVDLFWRVLHARSTDKFHHFPHFVGARRLHAEAKTVGQSRSVMEQIEQERSAIFGGPSPVSGIGRIASVALGISAKTGNLLREGLSGEYDLTPRRMIAAIVSDWKRVTTRLINS